MRSSSSKWIAGCLAFFSPALMWVLLILAGRWTTFLDWLEPGSVHYEAANTTFWIAFSIACILAGYLPLALVLRSSAKASHKLGFVFAYCALLFIQLVLLGRTGLGL